MINSFSFWSDGAPVQPGQPDYSFNYWSDGAPAPFFVTGLQIGASTGLFTVSGSDSNFRAGRVIQAGVGSFSVSGGSVLFHKTFTAGAGAFLVSAFPATLIYGGNPEPPTSGGGSITVGTKRKTKPTKDALISHLKISAKACYISTLGWDASIGRSESQDDDDAAFALVSALLD